jgi:hypothetical protein
VHGALHVHRHVFERALDGRNDVADAGEMDDVIGAGEQRMAGLEAADVGALELDVGIVAVGGDIVLAAADKVIDDADPEAARDQKVDHVAADEPGATGDDRAQTSILHFAPSFFIVRTL